MTTFDHYCRALFEPRTDLVSLRESALADCALLRWQRIALSEYIDAYLRNARPATPVSESRSEGRGA